MDDSQYDLPESPFGEAASWQQALEYLSRLVGSEVAVQVGLGGHRGEGLTSAGVLRVLDFPSPGFSVGTCVINFPPASNYVEGRLFTHDQVSHFSPLLSFGGGTTVVFGDPDLLSAEYHLKVWARFAQADACEPERRGE